MSTLFGMFPFLKTLFADSGYQRPKFAKALAKVLPHLGIEIVKRSDQVSGFVVLPKRWIPVDPKQISLTSKSLERRAKFCFLTTLGST